MESWWWLIVHSQLPSGFDHLCQGPNERLYLIDGLDARIMALGDVPARTLINSRVLYSTFHPSCTVYTNTQAVVHTVSLQLVLPARALTAHGDWRILEIAPASSLL